MWVQPKDQEKSVNDFEDVLSRVRSEGWSPQLPEARQIRDRAGRRRARRIAFVGVGVAAACTVAGAAIAAGGPGWFEGDDKVASTPSASLVFSQQAADAPGSQIVGTFDLADGDCLTFSGDVAVLPGGSTLVGDLVKLGGSRPAEVRIGEEVTLGGSSLNLDSNDVVDQMVDPETRAQFDLCARASGSKTWTLVTGP
jgi:hypothetical protein